MTDFVRFVNTASTAGSQDGTTNTPGNSGTAAYESLSKFNTAEAASLTGNTFTVNCSGTAADTVGNGQWTGWSNESATENITINGDWDDEHIYSTSHYRIEYTTTGTYQEGVNWAVGHTKIFDLQMQITSSDAGTTAYNLNATEIDVSRCVLRGVLSGTPTAIFGFLQRDAISGDMFSCLVYDWITGNNDPRGFQSNSITTPSFGFNLTAHNCSFGFHRSYLDFTVRNCLAQNCTDGFGISGSGWLNATNNCSDIASDAPGTSPQTGDVTFVDEAGDDFQLSDSDTVAKGNGVDLSGTFNFDLANNTMPVAWPIGCLQEAAAVGGASLLLISKTMRGVSRR